MSEVGEYRRREPVVKAIRMTKDVLEDASKWPKWLRDRLDVKHWKGVSPEYWLTAQHGLVRVRDGDWIAVSEAGTLQPYEHTTFESLFEPKPKVGRPAKKKETEDERDS